jgi:outer membrane lipoprotein-sorting protein
MKKLLGIMVLTLLLSGNASANEITLDKFFNKFNMRSTLSSMGPQLRYWCGSYPSEFFEIKEKMENRFILVRNENHFWDITILDDNKVVIYNRITNGTYSFEDEAQLIYMDDKGEWWDDISVKEGKLKNPETSDCKKQ